MITIADPSMIPTLKALWIEAFGDSMDYVDFFFNNRFNRIDTYVYLVDNVPVSMAFVFNEELCYKGEYLPAGYIYGVATANDHRSKGYSTQVLKRIHMDYPTTFLIPATKGLFDFYYKNGYKVAFSITEKRLHFHEMKSPNVSYSFESISPEEYKNIRDTFFKREGYVRWNLESITYSILENEVWDGKALKIILPKEKTNHIILYRYSENQLYIKETTLSGQELSDVAFLLMKENKVEKCHIRLAPDHQQASEPNSNFLEFGMLHSTYEVKNGYCNLVLD